MNSLQTCIVVVLTVGLSGCVISNEPDQLEAAYDAVESKGGLIYPKDSETPWEVVIIFEDLDDRGFKRLIPAFNKFKRVEMLQLEDCAITDASLKLMTQLQTTHMVHLPDEVAKSVDCKTAKEQYGKNGVQFKHCFVQSLATEH